MISFMKFVMSFSIASFIFGVVLMLLGVLQCKFGKPIRFHSFINDACDNLLFCLGLYTLIFTLLGGTLSILTWLVHRVIF